jgi:16S rRNA (adenine1518-N6/adenine1519-N6)-dimethyltransferase
MPEEMFDVVDENDNVVGQAARSVVHANQWLHRAVHIFVQNSAGELLIHQRSPQCDEHPLLWTSSASGHVTSGEDYDAAADREIVEELGITTPLKRLHKFVASPAMANEHTVLYLGKSDQRPTFQEAEIVTGEYLGISAIRLQINTSPARFGPPFRKLFAWFSSHLESAESVGLDEH